MFPTQFATHKKKNHSTLSKVRLIKWVISAITKHVPATTFSYFKHKLFICEATTQSVMKVVTQINVWHWSPRVLPAVLSIYYISQHILKVNNRYMLLYYTTLYKQWIQIKVFCNKDNGAHSMYLLHVIDCTFSKIILPVPKQHSKGLAF